MSIFTVPFLENSLALEGPRSASEGIGWATAPQGADIAFDSAGHSQDGHRGGPGDPLGGPEINLLGPLGERLFRKSAFFIKLRALLKPSYSLSKTHFSAKEGRRK